MIINHHETCGIHHSDACGCATKAYLEQLDRDIKAQADEVAEECAAWEPKDNLGEMWDQQLEFMRLLQEKRGFPDFPVDITSKSGQKLLKDISHDCMHELFEAVHLLKDSKSHRQTIVGGFDQEAFLEEMSDVAHYFFEILIAAGISRKEFVEAYLTKGDINVKRIKNGY